MTGDIVDPLNNRTFDGTSSLLTNHETNNSFQIVDVSKTEPHPLTTIPGVRKTLADSEEGREFYLASNGVWVLRSLTVERDRQVEVDRAN